MSLVAKGLERMADKLRGVCGVGMGDDWVRTQDKG